MKCPGNNTEILLAFIRPHHCMSLTTACLSICEDGAIISFKHIIDKGEGCLLVNLTLEGLNSKYAVIAEGLRRLFRVGLMNGHLVDAAIS